jgi:hypothetical protein
MGRWSAEWGWVKRAEAWDREADRQLLERDIVERAESRRRMIDEHARAGKTMVSVALAGLAPLDTSDPATADAARERIATLSPSEIARLLDAGTKIEQRARGDATRITDPEARAYAAGLIDVCLAYVPDESREPFLTDMDARLGLGGLTT